MLNDSKRDSMRHHKTKHEIEGPSSDPEDLDQDSCCSDDDWDVDQEYEDFFKMYQKRDVIKAPKLPCDVETWDHYVIKEQIFRNKAWEEYCMKKGISEEYVKRKPIK